jgi:Co/Zn/Cd efflux system component
MSERVAAASSADRAEQITTALRLVVRSVAFGIVSGAVSVITGLGLHSLSVLAVGLGVLADVAGSAVLIWRFRAERFRPTQCKEQEKRAAAVVATALAVVSVVLVAESVTALVSGTRPGTSGITLIAAGVSLLVLTPLSYAKRRLGGRMDSRALQGDGTLSAIGAATSLLALAALALNDALGWWWADRVTALVVAVIAGIEAWHTAPRPQPLARSRGSRKEHRRLLGRRVTGAFGGRVTRSCNSLIMRAGRKAPKEVADVLDQQCGFFEGGEMTAAAASASRTADAPAETSESQ